MVPAHGKQYNAPLAAGSVWRRQHLPRLELSIRGAARRDGSYMGEDRDKAAFQYVQESIDQLVEPDGSIPGYDAGRQSMDDFLLGRQLLLLYRVAGKDKYRKAAFLIRAQLTTQTRNASGGFWHTRNFPSQMLLDDEYMFGPFYAEFASTFQSLRTFPTSRDNSRSSKFTLARSEEHTS